MVEGHKFGFGHAKFEVPSKDTDYLPSSAPLPPPQPRYRGFSPLMSRQKTQVHIHGLNITSSKSG